ncbi:hypothetical protein ASC93_10175 [Massilia sp. Root335]|nr:hypothetical protein ASC93_10175 [Massilia sp. Root335]
MFALPLATAAQGFTGTVDLSARDAAATRHLTISHWRVDKRGVPSFDYRYTQDGPGCTYRREGHAVAGYDDNGDNGDSVELEVYNPQGADGKEGAPVGAFYDEPNGVVFGMPVRGKGAEFWVSFDDPRMKKTLPATCGFTAHGAAVMLRK